MIYEDEITLPDGRVVHARVIAIIERDTNAIDIQYSCFCWRDGTDLIADECNEDLGGIYLHEFVTEKVLLTTPFYDDD